jgi:DNA transposition AAA+ family ATPase
MKRGFVRVKNVDKFVGAMENLLNKADGIEGMGLVIGEKGIGKTRTAVWYLANVEETVYVRAKANWRPAWMLREIVGELGIAGDRTIENLHYQTVNALLERPRLIFIDEVKHLLTSSRLVETVKDLHDGSGCPIVLLGEIGAERSLARFASLFDRFNQIVRFTRLDNEDMEKIITAMLEIEMDAEGRQTFIDLTEKRLRPAIINLFKVERWCKATKIETVSSQHVRGVLMGKGFSANTQSRRIAAAAGGQKTVAA